MRHIDLNMLGHLAVLLETRSVSQAALRLGISQPAMSRSLAELRTLFGDPLLVRTRNGMLPTRRAEELIGPLRQWLADAGALVLPEAFNPARLVRRFRIGAGAYGVRAAIAPALPDLLAAAPGVAIDITADSGDVRARLASGELDLVITDAAPDPQLLHDRLLLVERFACIVRAGHPLLACAAARPVRLDDYAGWPHIAINAGEAICDPLAEALERLGAARQPVATLPFAEAAVALVGGCDAILTLPEAAARRAAAEGFGLLPAPAELGRFELRALWHNRGHRDPALHWLVGLLAGERQEACAPILEAAE